MSDGWGEGESTAYIRWFGYFVVSLGCKGFNFN